MKKAIVLLAGVGLGVILLAGGYENSASEDRVNSTTIDTLSVNVGQVANQESATSQMVVPKKRFSFKPKPLSECKSFLITEFGLAYGLDKPSDRTNLGLITWEFGYMVNRDEHSAIGGTVFISSEGDRPQVRFGLKGRYRYWLSKDQSLDIAPGVLITGSRDEFEGDFVFPSFTCQTGLNLSSWFAVTGQVDIIRRKTIDQGYPLYALQEKTVTKPEWYLGFKIGTPAGVGISTAVVIVAALVIASNLSVPDMSGSF
jgi:outer membrane murein-binding lipoprotein Lpp